MDMPQIRMQSQMAQIQIQQTDARMQIRQPKAELHIEQPPADISIQITPGKLQIDQSKAFADMNLMHIFDLNKQFANEASSAAMQGVTRRASEGTEMMKIENGGNPVIDQAVRNAYDSMKQLGIEFIPSSFSVETSYQPAQVNIDVQTNKPIIEATVNQPETIYQPSRVQTSMQQYPELHIEFINLQI